MRRACWAAHSRQGAGVLPTRIADGAWATPAACGGSPPHEGENNDDGPHLTVPGGMLSSSRQTNMLGGVMAGQKSLFYEDVAFDTTTTLSLRSHPNRPM